MRSERSHKPFLLMLINVADLLIHPNDTTILKRLIPALYESTREIDIKGWYEQGKTLGIIFAEVSSDSAARVTDKVSVNLNKHLNPGQFKLLNISTYTFPGNKQEDLDNRQKLLKFYPKLAEQLKGRRSYFLKRAIDIAFSLPAICFLLPLLLSIAMLVKATSKGPVIFSQTRMGLGGKEFSFLKFRSMNATSGTDLHKNYTIQLINGGAHSSKEPDKIWCKIKDDPRITTLGRFLRKTSLDELPQLLNVLRGDMSLVGPRPPIPYEFEQYSIWHLRRVLEIKPGITGYWQVQGRNSTTFDDMVRMDIQYSQQWSVWLDLKLLFQTPLAVLSTRGAS